MEDTILEKDFHQRRLRWMMGKHLLEKEEATEEEQEEELARKRSCRWRISSPDTVVAVQEEEEEEIPISDDSYNSTATAAITSNTSSFHQGWTMTRGFIGVGGRNIYASPLPQMHENNIDEQEFDLGEGEDDPPYGAFHSFGQAVNMASSETNYSATMNSGTPPLFSPLERQGLRRPLRWGRLVVCCILSCWALLMVSVKSVTVAVPRTGTTTTTTSSRNFILPSHRPLTDLTLRNFLNHPDGYSLGMAPAFFGFYGYFGGLIALEEAGLLHTHIRGVAGASAGAMAAVLLAAGLSPQQGADFCTKLKLRDFADPPAVLAAFRGDRFEALMEELLASHSRREMDGLLNNKATLLLQDAQIPVAVSAFDLQTLQGQILTMGS
jgi:hypothetical protein